MGGGRFGRDVVSAGGVRRRTKDTARADKTSRLGRLAEQRRGFKSVGLANRRHFAMAFGQSLPGAGNPLHGLSLI